MKPKIAIRPCRAEECPAVLDLWRRAGATPSATDNLAQVAQLLGEPQAVLLVARHDELIVGSVIGGWDGWRGNIYRLAVLPEYQRQGIARALVRAVETILAEKGARRLSALVEHQRPWAVGFWDALASIGYHQDPRMIRYVKILEPPRGRPSPR